MVADTDLIELLELLEPEDPKDVHEPLTDQAVDDLCEEIEDEELWKRNAGIVEDDVFRFVDNPRVPGYMERIAMLEKLDSPRWYDKWVAQRTADATEYFDVTEGTGDVELMNMAKKTVDQAMEKLENQESLVTAINNSDGVIALADETLDFGLKGTYWEKFDFSQGMELQKISMQPIVEPLEMPYYAIDEAGEVFSNSRLADLAGRALPGLDAVNLDLIPTLAELGEAAMGVVGGVLGGFALEGLIKGFTPIIQHLVDTGWIRHPGGISKEAAESVQNALQFQLGEYWELRQNLASYFREHPTYLWVFDDGQQSSPPATVQYAMQDPAVKNRTHIIMGTKSSGHDALPGTNLWARGRVVTLQGTSVGFADSDWNLLIQVQLGNGDINIKQLSWGSWGYWVDASVARILNDNDQAKQLCLRSNLSSLYFRGLDGYPWADTPPDPTPNQVFWQQNTVNPWVPEKNDPWNKAVKTETAPLSQLQPGNMQISFQEPYYERLRKRRLSMPDWMYLDYVRRSQNGMYVIGGHMSSQKYQNLEEEYPDRFLFELDEGVRVDYRLTPQSFVVKEFSQQKDVWFDKLFTQSRVGEFVTTIWADSKMTLRIKGKAIANDGEKWLYLTKKDGTDEWWSDKNLIERLRPATIPEIDAWSRDFQLELYREETDVLLKRWQEEHDANNGGISAPEVPKPPVKGLAAGKAGDKARLQVALSEITDLRRRLVNAGESLSLEEKKAETPPHAESRPDPFGFPAVENTVDYSPFLFVGAIALLLCYA